MTDPNDNPARQQYEAAQAARADRRADREADARAFQARAVGAPEAAELTAIANDRRLRTEPGDLTFIPPPERTAPRAPAQADPVGDLIQNIQQRQTMEALVASVGPVNIGTDVRSPSLADNQSPRHTENPIPADQRGKDSMFL